MHNCQKNRLQGQQGTTLQPQRDLLSKCKMVQKNKVSIQWLPHYGKQYCTCCSGLSFALGVIFCSLWSSLKGHAGIQAAELRG